MAKYSPVGPIGWLEQLQDRNLLGDYLLLLAHDVLEEQQRYRSLLARVRDNNVNPFIILDNSMIELGAALPAQQMRLACDVVQPSCVVLPDVLGQSQQTVAASILGAEKYRKAGISHAFMAVIQGNNLPELQWCAQQLAIHVKPLFWGLPRIVANGLGTRTVFDYVLNFTNDHIRRPCAHLLGMSNNLADDVMCAQVPGIMGIDSANPIILGQNGKLLSVKDYQHVSREGVWGDTKLTTASFENVDRIRDWVAGI